ncbi:nicotinate-nucleotide adenylyltransferase [Demequina aurantiaca]|uniref:nicotinate-nucleotide adenylyltransferase n=1 Tax=Demequina aurantiaca TaxID=676200 RepID=UPI001F02FD17|nr:nicotinate-nucleotide adenylyltransferase [Demequina aurantiaca]
MAPVTDVSASRTRIGVLGGTFDPIHHGHLAAASEVCAALRLDQVLIVPTAVQPFKRDSVSASKEHRVAMCEKAVRNDARFEVSTVDIDRGGVTYTVDTLRDLKAQYPSADFFFITGADSLARLSEWKDAEQLGELAQFVGVTRAGHSFPQLETTHRVVEAPSLAISSTDIRRRVRAGVPIRYLMPASVVDYISKHELYLGGLDD